MTTPDLETIMPYVHHGKRYGNMTAETERIIHLLYERHPAPEWATFGELPNSTGFEANRIMDFFAFNTYPSKGFLRIAYEVKVSRADFSKELQNPTKRQPAETLANECWFVTPAGMVKPDEVPEGWGLLEVMKNQEGLRAKKKAQYRNIENLPLGFIAAILRRSSDSPPQIPKALWKYQGQEVPFEELAKLANGEVEKRVAEIVEKKEQEAEKRIWGHWRVKLWEKMYNAIHEALGRNVDNPQELIALLEGQKQPYLDPGQKALLEEMKDLAWKVWRELPRG